MSARVDPDTVDLAAAVPRAKLRLPVSADRLISRPRLQALLDEDVAAPVTFVVGPAGSGKTSLLASWSAHAGWPVAWLSLDETDQDASQLWRGVVAALQQVAPGLGVRAALLLDRPSETLAAVDELLTELEDARGEPTVLILDDLHLVDEIDAVDTSLALFLQNLPRWLHVVIASRRIPPVPVQRMRARGLLHEVGYAQLRFSAEEARELLSHLAPGLDPALLQQATTRADGWAASLRLSALAARRRPGAPGIDTSAGAGPGDEALVTQYLWQEVFAGEDQELVDTLVETSVVERVSASLGERLTGRRDVAALLANAEQRGLFVSRVESSDWYEVHALVRGLLLTELGRRAQGAPARQHARAAEWFAERAQVAAALDHWLLAEQPREALRLLADSSAALYDHGREATLARVVGRIPAEVVGADLEALIEYAWCHVLVDRRRFWELAARASQRAAEPDPITPGPTPEVVARLRMLEAIESASRGDLARCAALTQEALDTFGASWSSDLLGQFAWNMVARDIALSERWVDPGSEVDRARTALSLDRHRSSAFEGTRALGEAMAGHPAQTLRVAAEIRRGALATERTILRIELAVAEAIAQRELGNRTAAIPAFLDLVDHPVGPLLYARLLALLELTGLRLDEGDLDTAERMFGQAASVVATDMPGPDARTWLARTGTLLALRSGRVDDADGWADQVQDEFWSGISRARVRLARDDHEGAREALATRAPRCARHAVVLQLLDYRLACADPERPAGDLDRTGLLEAARVAVAHGLVQTVASEGPDVLAGLDALAWQLPGPWLDDVRRAAQVSPYASVAARLAHLIDPLTERELDVLRLLPTRLTLREIAARLSISPNTLKTHLRSVYRKLECGSRSEAADIARSLDRAARPAASGWTGQPVPG